MPLSLSTDELQHPQDMEDVTMEDVSTEKISAARSPMLNLDPVDIAVLEVSIAGASDGVHDEAEVWPAMPREMATDSRRPLALVGQTSTTPSQHAASQREVANSSSTTHDTSIPVLPSIYPDYYDGPYAAALSHRAQ
jgi:hypothetical protein